MSKKNVPAISVVIPMYNSEKYIGECLESILAQTFTDYEIVVADDCSTDNSRAIVESYIAKTENKIRLIKLKKNSGSPSVPRNTAMKAATGEYIFFADSDDAVLNNALENSYLVAKKYDADVVHCQRFYRSQNNIISKNIEDLQIGCNVLNPDFVTEPSKFTDNIIKRIMILCMNKFDWSTWTNFVRRNLVAKYDLKFFESKVCGDTFFALQLLCLAKNIVITPNIHYIYRKNELSVTQSDLKSAEKIITRWGDFFFRVIPEINNFMNRFPVFKENPQYKYNVYGLLMNNNSAPLLEIYENNPPYVFDELICKELKKVKDKTALTAFLFARVNLASAKLVEQHKKIKELQEQLRQ